MLVDSHCHLDRVDLKEFSEDLQGVLDHARSLDVGHFLCVCIDLENFSVIKKIAETYKDIVISVGLHPNEPTEDEPTVEKLCELAAGPLVVAIGETGLDYFRSDGDLSWQKDRFRTHIRAAIAMNKPLIIHTRQAQQDTIAIMKEESADKVAGVMHCFTEDWDMAKQALDLGFYISFSGIVTFSNATVLKEVARKVPLDRLLVETDCPYLTPAPHRGKTNYPGYVRYVAEHIAELRGISYAEVAAVTTQNFFRLFSLASQKNAGLS